MELIYELRVPYMALATILTRNIPISRIAPVVQLAIPTFQWMELPPFESRLTTRVFVLFSVAESATA